VCDVYDADTLVPEAFDDTEQGLYLIEGKRGGGLVEDQHLGVTHDATKDLHHLLLGDGERVGLAGEVQMPADLIHGRLELGLELRR